MSHIKLHGVKPRIQYVANGILKTFEFPFVIFTKSDIQVYFNDTLQDPTIYTVTGIKNTDGGSITFTETPSSGTIITITRDLSIERTTDFQDGGALRADTLNDEFDYQTACLQQVADNLNRSMILPPYAADTNVDLTLPSPSAGKAIVWNSDGTNLENSAVKINELESTLRAYKETAKSASEKAVSSANTASEQALNATQQAQIATQKATEATETLTIKANVDLDNLSAFGKSTAANLVMPSNTYIDTTFVKTAIGSYTYTAPANGYFCLVVVHSTSGSRITLYKNDVIVASDSSQGHNGYLCFTYKKDDIIKVQVASGALYALTAQHFFYAEGEI